MKIAKKDDIYTLSDVDALTDTLEKGTYMIKYDPVQNIYFLKKKENFKLPSKLYGDFDIVNRWITAHNANPGKNMGILLAGIKGSGKTITAEKMCIDSDLPVIIQTEAYHDADYIDFITSKCWGRFILFIDEFEKVYQERSLEVNSFLRVMDGGFDTDILFLLTVNELTISTYMTNRLGRIKYKETYESLPEEIMMAVINDLLVNKSEENITSIKKFFDRVNMCTFDLLVTLIKEMNLFNEDAITCGMKFNLVPEQDVYDVVEIFKGKEYQCWPITFNMGMEHIRICRKSTKHLPKSKQYDEDLSMNVKEECKVNKNGPEIMLYLEREKATFKLFKSKKENFLI